MPGGVSLLNEGTVKYYSQRVTRPPMVDCMFAAVCTPLSFMGYALPESFVGDLRKASGVPVRDEKGRPQGTSTAATRTALKKLLPDAPLRFGGLADEDMLKRIAAGEIAVRVVVDCRRLPPGKLRRYVGSFQGLHAVAIGGARRRASDGEWEVRYLDPAGPRRKYEGQWVRYARVKDALRRTASGKVAVTYGEKDAALPRKAPPRTKAKPSTPGAPPKEGTVKVLTRGFIDEHARITRGTPFLHPETMEKVTQAGSDDDFRLAGRSLDGKFAGVWVDTGRIPGASGPTLLLVEVSQIGSPFIRERD